MPSDAVIHQAVSENQQTVTNFIQAEGAWWVAPQHPGCKESPECWLSTWQKKTAAKAAAAVSVMGTLLVEHTIALSKLEIGVHRHSRAGGNPDRGTGFPPARE